MEKQWCRTVMTVSGRVLIWAALLMPAMLVAQVTTSEGMSARSVALGGMSTVGARWAFAASLPFEPSAGASLSYHNRFAMADLSTYAVGVWCPNRWLDLGLYYRRFGYSDYNENMLVLSAAKRIADDWALGVNVGYEHRYVASEVDAPQFLTADLSFRGNMGDRLELSGRLSNLLFAELVGLQPGVTLDFLHVALGAAFWLDDAGQVMGEVAYSPLIGVQGRVGVEYRLVEAFAVRGGVMLNPTAPTLGFELRFMPLVLDVAMAYRAELGVTTMLELTYLFAQ